MTDAELSRPVRRHHRPAVARARQRDCPCQGHRRQVRRVLGVVFCEADANAGISGIRWAGYQAVTDYLDQYSPAKGPDVAMGRAARVASGAGSQSVAVLHVLVV